MTTKVPDGIKPLIDYWNAVDAALLKFFGVYSADGAIEASLIASAQEQGQTPQAFALWYDEKHSLQYLRGNRIFWER